MKRKKKGGRKQKTYGRSRKPPQPQQPQQKKSTITKRKPQGTATAYSNIQKHKTIQILTHLLLAFAMVILFQVLPTISSQAEPKVDSELNDRDCPEK